MLVTLKPQETIRDAARRAQVDAAALAKAAGVADIDLPVGTGQTITVEDRFIAGSAIAGSEVDALTKRRPLDTSRSPLAVRLAERTARIQSGSVAGADTFFDLLYALDTNPMLGRMLQEALLPGSVVGRAFAIAVDLAQFPVAFPLAFIPKPAKVEELLMNVGVITIERRLSRRELHETIERFEGADPLGKAMISETIRLMVAAQGPGVVLPGAKERIAKLHTDADQVASPGDKAVARCVVPLMFELLNQPVYFDAERVKAFSVAFAALSPADQQAAAPVIRDLVMPDGKPFETQSRRGVVLRIPEASAAALLALLPS